MRILLQNGARVDQTYPVDGNTALHLSCKNGDVDSVKALLDHGASIYTLNKEQMDPIMIAEANKNHSREY